MMNLTERQTYKFDKSFFHFLESRGTRTEEGMRNCFPNMAGTMRKRFFFKFTKLRNTLQKHQEVKADTKEYTGNRGKTVTVLAVV